MSKKVSLSKINKFCLFFQLQIHLDFFICFLDKKYHPSESDRVKFKKNKSNFSLVPAISVRTQVSNFFSRKADNVFT